jgi:non-specific serine/threonine protein kinase/serine/threonine-protein kinase
MPIPTDAERAAFLNDVERVFSSVVGLDQHAGRVALDMLCAGRGDLRAEVESLLDAHGRAVGFLADPIGDAADQQWAPASRNGQRIGSFTLVELIASGGMGAVYRAERADGDFTQQVAVKIISAPMGHPESARRFRAERQILAALHHPHIVALLDGGITPAGEAYLVMEYVEGSPLSAYCQQRSLPLRARLELFRHVCGAVEYLHQNLVVHRDLKPTNILVTRDGVPKVLDFGIAKLVEPPSAGTTEALTRPEERALTPNYASPEQLRGLPVTVASDVYSLGVLLYEVLTGVRPYDATGKPLDETLRLVLDTVPIRPSAAARGEIDPPYDVRTVRGDLDAIVLRALRKQPDERYTSARALSDDLTRYLEGRPVEAREPSLGYVLKRLATRHKAVFTTAAASLVVILGLLALSLREADAARAERDRAEARFQDVRRLANSVIYELHDAIANLPGATPARRLLVTRALEYLDRLDREVRDDVALKRELAAAYQRVAQVQNGGLGANLGDTQAALESYGKALAIRQSLAARTPAEPQDVVGLAVVEFDLGALHRFQGQLGRAEESFLSSAERLERLRAAGHESLPSRLAGIYQRLAEVQTFQGKKEMALQSAQKAVTEADAVWRRQPKDALSRSVLAAASHQLADALADGGRYPEALERTRQARRLLEEALNENPLDAQQTRILLFALNGESRYLIQLGDPRGAVGVNERALQIAGEALRRDPRDNWSRMAFLTAIKALAESLFEAGDRQGSVRRFREALDIANKAAAEDPENRYVRLETASAEYGLALALFSAPTPDGVVEGCSALRRVQAFWTSLQSRGELPAGEAADLGGIPRLLARCPAGS